MTWLLLALLICLLLFVLYRPKPFDQDLQQKLNLKNYQQRHQEISHSELDQNSQQLLLLELDKELLAQQQKAQDFASNRPAPLWFIPLLSTITLLLSYGFYHIWGAQNELETTALIAKATQADLSADESQQLIRNMHALIQKQPKKLEWQYLLGQFLNAQEDYQQAAQVFAALLKNLPEENQQDRAATLADLAQARFFANRQQANEDDYKLLEQSLAIMPERMGTLGIAGMLAFELGYFEKAIAHWRKMWHALAPSSEKQALEKGIKVAAQRLAQQGKQSDLSWLTPLELTVNLSLSKQAKAHSKEEDIIFLIAQEKHGSPMPIAAKRLRVKDLPMQVTLSSLQRMQPNKTLADVKQVNLIARLSKSGQIKAQTGDWQGRINNVNTHKKAPINLIINLQISKKK